LIGLIHRRVIFQRIASGLDALSKTETKAVASGLRLMVELKRGSSGQTNLGCHSNSLSGVCRTGLELRTRLRNQLHVDGQKRRDKRMKILELKPHPYSQILPKAHGDDYNALREGVRKHGKLRYSIVVYEDMILDGNQRLRACKETGVEPKWIEFTGTDVQAMDTVWVLNFGRRNMSARERTFAASKYLLFVESKGLQSPETQKVIAAKAGVSAKSVRRATRVLREGTEEEKAALESGESGMAPLAEAIARREHDSDLRDDDGYPIPSGDASYYWRRRPEAEALLALVVKAGKMAKTLDKDDVMWINMDVNTVLGELRSVAHRIKTGAIPRHVCLGCNGINPVKCQHCKGRGVVPDIVWGHEPEEKRKARERA
jgi:hypothetical protein